MTTQHTPSLWELEEVRVSADCKRWILWKRQPATECMRENPTIAVFEEMGGSIAGEREGRANAVLSKAGPDMLEALEAALPFVTDEQLVSHQGSPKSPKQVTREMVAEQIRAAMAMAMATR